MQNLRERAQRLATAAFVAAALISSCSVVTSDASRFTPREPSRCGSLLEAGDRDSHGEESDRTKHAKEYWDCRVVEASAMDYVGSVQRKSRALEWHHAASVYIFFVVVSMVACGLWFSATQFQKSMAEDIESKESELDLSMRGLKFKSGTMGVLILGLSFGFFLVYVTKVYPVRPLTLEGCPPPPHEGSDIQLPPPVSSAAPAPGNGSK